MATPSVNAPTPEPVKAAPFFPRWFIRSAWVGHRALYNVTRGRVGLKPATETAWGMMRLKTIGRRSGKGRVAILGYFEDGENLVTLAMNGWGAPEPAWWLNLQAQPDTLVELSGRGWLPVHGRAATTEERPRLWSRWGEYNGENLEAWASRRPGETAVVVLEPR
ncbi:MAG: nitroreductase/quinone reductase family protein [Chloroflexota bacterium]